MRRTTIRITTILLLLASVLIPSGPVQADRSKSSYTKTWEKYTVPDVTLVNQDGVKVNLRNLLLQDKPVLVDFIYTTCTTICPVLSANFVNFQRRMSDMPGTYQLVSISIDPENDTPKAMKTYLKRYSAKPGWDFLTGSRKDINDVIKAFKALDVLTMNKMDHYPLILLKSRTDDRWGRIFGLIGTTELMKEYEGVTK